MNIQLTIKWFTLILGVVTVRATGAVCLVALMGPTVPTKWFLVDDCEVSFSLEGLFNPESAGIPTASIKSIKGKAKLVQHVRGEYSIGYVIDIEAQPLDQEHLAAKYKEKRVIPTEGGPLTVLPKTQVAYKVRFTISLLDSDGFTIVSMESPEQSIFSGTTTRLQDQTTQKVSSQQAALVRDISVAMQVNGVARGTVARNEVDVNRFLGVTIINQSTSRCTHRASANVLGTFWRE